MKRSSSTSDGRGLFDGVLARGGAFEATTDAAWLEAMLAAEAALTAALADVGQAPRSAADAVAVAAQVDRFDIAALGRDAARGGNPVIPLVEALRAAVGPPHDRYVHAGATSQDILDTAAMTITARASGAIAADLDRAATHAAALAQAHRETPMLGRTLLQAAAPTTFGLQAATWLVGLDRAAQQLDDVRRHHLAVQLGGPTGTLAAYGDDAFAVLEQFALTLALAVPVAPWHTERSRIAEIAGALGGVAAAVDKAALDIVLLAQSEVAEVAEVDAGSGGSSSMAHKHNPIAAVSARAGAMQAPGLVAALLTAAAHEHQRAAGAWHAEWRPLVALLRTTGSAVAWLAESLRRLHVDATRMRRNLVDSGLDGPTGAAPALVTRILAQHDQLRERGATDAGP
jgi:3-carboxy-cis,cis-muconate cycloisomerase